MFKVTKETDNHYVVTHPDGHFLKIAKKGLSKDVEEHLKKMACGGAVKMSKGGQVNPKLQQSHVKESVKPMMQQEVQHFDDGGQVDNGLFSGPPNGGAGTGQPPAYMNPPQPVAPNQQSIPAREPQQAQAMPQSSPLMPGMEQMYEQQGKALQSGFNQQQSALKEYQQRRAQWDQESQNMMDDLKNDKLDFNRVWQNKDTGQKVLTSLGLILSGIGSGLTGQQNMAQQVLDKEIERDVDQQKTELGKKESLYEFNLQRYKNDQDATLATMAQMHDLTNQKMQLIALQQNSPMALQAYMKKQQDTQAKFGPPVDSMLQRQSQSATQQAPQVVNPQVDANRNTIPMSLQWLKATGRIDDKTYEAAMSEQKDMAEMQRLHGYVQNTFDKLSAMPNGGQASVWHPESGSERESDITTIAQELMKRTLESKRIPDEETAYKKAESMLPGEHMADLTGVARHFGANAPFVKIPAESEPSELEAKRKNIEKTFDLKEYSTLKGLQDRGFLPNIGIK